MKYYPPQSTCGSSVCPFLKAVARSFWDSQSGVEIGRLLIVDLRSGNATGGQLGGGAGFVLMHGVIAMEPEASAAISNFFCHQ